MIDQASSTERFGNLVEDYDRYRPTYPAEVMRCLTEEAGLLPSARVADIGSGTGISSAPFVALGCTVHGVEPNGPMRAAAERRFEACPNFRSVAGSAEHTGLPDACVDWVVAAQAFHWFDRGRAQQDFQRILRPGGQVILLFNERLNDATPFLRDYEDTLLEHAIDYTQVNHANLTADVFDAFYHRYTRRDFPNEQVMDLDGMLGRVRSCSYVPHPGDAGWPALEQAMRELFARHQLEDRIVFLYETQVYWGTLPNAGDSSSL